MPDWLLAHHRSLSLDRPRLMAVLNVTPDSFSDGGRFVEVEKAVKYTLECLNDGADLIDIGGESTRPGANRVSPRDQISRVLPVIEAILQARPDTLISIDTTRTEVARAALEAGAHIINDVSAASESPDLLTLAAHAGAGLILMHRLKPPEEDSFSDTYDREPEYEDVVASVAAYLAGRAQAAQDVGVAPESIVIDPGVGFGKSVDQNFELIARIEEIVGLGYPVLAAASRKSFIGAVSGVEVPEERLAGTLAANMAYALSGVRLFRVHDVAAHREALAVAMKISATRAGSNTPNAYHHSPTKP